MGPNDCIAIIKDGALTIRVPVSELGTLVEGSWATGNLDTRFAVTDPDAFAEDLARELNSDDEEGTTMIHRMFDAAINEAIEQGADGIEEHENQEA